MTELMTRTVATGAAVTLLLLAPAWSSAHKAHEEAAREAAKVDPPNEILAPVTVAKPEISPPSETLRHDHSAHGGDSHHAPSLGDPAVAEAEASPGNVPKALAWLGKFHPPVTHFPIALLVAAAFAELLFMRTGKLQFDHAARFSVWLGAGAALAAAPLGWFFAGFQFVDDDWVQTAHRWFGTATALWSGGLLIVLKQLTQAGGSRGRFRLVLFAGTALVSITGFLGGSLLYGINHYAW